MSDYNVPNYTEQGGAKTVIGGEIDVTGALKIDGTEVTPSAVEINVVDNVTAGVAAASKAVVLDANKKVSGIVLVSPKIDDTDTGVTVTSANQTNASTTVTIPNVGDAADTFVMADTTQTLTNKTHTDPVINTPDITFGVSSHDYGAAAADWTLSGAEMKSLILMATNASGAVNAIATPTTGKVYIVVNTSGQALTFKAAGQAGITIASTKTAMVRGNGTDFVRVTADA